MIIRTYCLIGAKYVGLWLRLHPAHWAMFFLYSNEPHYAIVTQFGPINIRIGRSWML